MKRIEPRYVTFGQAKLLKEKGFDVKCSRYYEYALKSRKNKEDGYSGPFGWKKGELNLQVDTFINGGYMDVSNESWYLCAVPEQCQVVEWLRVNHGIWVSVQPNEPFIDHDWCFKLFKDNQFLLALEGYISPQEAYTEAFNYIMNNNDYVS